MRRTPGHPPRSSWPIASTATPRTIGQLQTRGLTTHIAPCTVERAEAAGIFSSSAFTYDQATNTYRCPAAQTLYPRHWNERRQATEYTTRKGVCARCLLRDQCTRSRHGRTLHCNDGHELIERAKQQGLSLAARLDRIRWRYLMEGSFAQAANVHGFKRSRWRRLARQQIQDWLIAACQNIKILIKTAPFSPRTATELASAIFSLSNRLRVIFTKPDWFGSL